MPLLQKPLEGLSSFIGLFRGGAINMDFNNVLQPTLSMDEWLNPGGYAIVQASAVAPEGSLDLVVPDGKSWRIKYVMTWIDNSNALDFTMATVFLRKAIGGTTLSLAMSPFPGVPIVGTARSFGGSVADGYGFPACDVTAQSGDGIRLQLRRSGVLGTYDLKLAAFVQQLDV